jgi:putative spermidine/putrescine transport system substrate-binding protein
MGLIDEMTVAENQAKMANIIAYAPTNPEAYKGIKPDVLPWLATAPDNAKQGFLINAEYYRDNLKSLQERWLAWRRA